VSQLAEADAKRVAAVIFDMDGVLIDSEQVWEEVRRAVVAEFGGHWQADTQRRLMGMSTPEWAAYLSGELGVRLSARDVADEVIRRMVERYAERLPLIDGAPEAVSRLAARWPIGIASSSPRSLIEVALQRMGIHERVAAIVSSDEVPRGKPAPDVYEEAARRLNLAAERCAAVEDSSNGLRSAAAAGMRVIAMPNPHYPPDADALAQADLVLRHLSELTVETIEGLAGH